MLPLGSCSFVIHMTLDLPGHTGLASCDAIPSKQKLMSPGPNSPSSNMFSFCPDFASVRPFATANQSVPSYPSWNSAAVITNTVRCKTLPNRKS
jgi:hypothetical protein